MKEVLLNYDPISGGIFDAKGQTVGWHEKLKPINEWAAVMRWIDGRDREDDVESFVKSCEAIASALEIWVALQVNNQKGGQV